MKILKMIILSCNDNYKYQIFLSLDLVYINIIYV